MDKLYLYKILLFITGTAAASGYGYYFYTGASTLTGVNAAIHFTGGTADGFSYSGVAHGYMPAVTFVFYQTRGTTAPIPASGDYKLLFAKTVPANTNKVDCSDVLPALASPIPTAGNTTGLGETAPLRNKGVYLERGDRIYVGVFADTINTSGYIQGAHVYAQGGLF